MNENKLQKIKYHLMIGKKVKTCYETVRTDKYYEALLQQIRSNLIKSKNVT